MNERQLTALLRDTPVPDEREARERGWRVVRAAFGGAASGSGQAAREPARDRACGWPADRRSRAEPCGAKVADLVHDVVQPGERNAQPSLTSLPASGRLLVTSSKGPWVVDQDGSKRLLGAYQDAAWSPHGLYVAATRGRQLTALEPTGTVHWSLAAPHPVTDPAWSPSGIRIAYLSGTSLRVVNGDGTDDHLVARGVARVPPAWRPLRGGVPPGRSVVTGRGTNVLAYVDRRGQVLVRDVDTDRLLIRNPPGPPPTEVAWSSDGARLLSASRRLVATFDSRSSIASRPRSGPRTGGRSRPRASSRTATVSPPWKPAGARPPRGRALSSSDEPTSRTTSPRGCSRDRVASRSRRGRRTGAGCSSAGRTPTSGSSCDRATAGCARFRTSPGSSTLARPASRPSRASAAGAARLIGWPAAQRAPAIPGGGRGPVPPRPRSAARRWRAWRRSGA